MSREWDYTLIVLWLAAVTVGFVMVASASFPLGVALGAPARFIVRHGAYLLLGAVALGVCLVVPLRVWQAIHRPLLVGALVLALLVLLPGIGHMVNGSRRWIGLGPFSVQAAEVAKFGLVIYLGGYLTQIRPRSPPTQSP